MERIEIKKDDIRALSFKLLRQELDIFFPHVLEEFANDFIDAGKDEEKRKAAEEVFDARVMAFRRAGWISSEEELRKRAEEILKESK